MKYALRAIMFFLMVLCIGYGFRPAPTSGQSASILPQFGHVILVVGENTDYSSSVGGMTYLDSLIAKYGLATNYYADTHPSIGNYFVLTAGQIFSNNDSDTPSSLPLSSANIAFNVQQAGKTWKDYEESTNGCGAVTSGKYIVRHDPLPYYTDINTQSANFVCISQFATDIQNHALPNFSYLAPNGCDDAHDCSLSTFDNFLKVELTPLLASSYFQPGGDGLLIVTFDEDSGSGSTSQTGTTDGGQVETVVISPLSKVGYQSTTRYYHENLLRTMAQALGASYSNLGAAASAAPMADFFNAGTSTGSVTLSPTSLSFGNVNVGATATLPVALNNTTSSSVSVSGIGISPSTAGFTETNNCPSSLSANSNCTISVTFKPAAGGSASATLSVTAGSTLTASISGSGVAVTTGSPVVSLSPASLTFPSTNMGSTSAAQTVTLSNTGNAALNLTSTGITVTGPFAETNTCGSSVAAGANCTISVTFAPTVSGTATGNVSISDNASGSPQSVGLSGTGATSSTGGGGSGGGMGMSASCPSGSTLYYVSTTGSDSSGSGSSSSPWATIQYASTKVGPGACVQVAPGTYSQGNILTNASGTSSARITYLSTTLWGAKLVNTSYNGSLNQNVWDNEGNYVTIKGFDVSGDSYQGIGNGGSNAQIIGNHVHNVVPADCNSNGGAGIVDHGSNSDDIGNVVQDVGNFSLGTCTYVHGIYANRSGGHIWNNIVFHVWSFGIQLWGSPQSLTISGNTVFNNGNSGLVIGSDTSAANNMVVTDNIFMDNGDYGFEEQGSTGSSNQYDNNLSFGNGKGFYNLQTGTQSATVESDPLFVNYQSDGGMASPTSPVTYYQLQSTSPAINAGTSQGSASYDYSGNPRPTGNAWDIGAYQFALTTSTGSLTVSPTSLSFPHTNLGSTSPAQVVTLTNTGTSAITLSNIAVTGSFAETTNCGTSLAASASCTINVTFDPSVMGMASGTLTITDSAPGSPQTVTLGGAGSDFSMACMSPTATVSAGQTASYPLTMTPMSGFNSQITLACSGAPQKASCQVTPAMLTLDGTNPGTATLSVTTTASSTGWPHGGTKLIPPMGRMVPLWPLGIWIAVLTMLAVQLKDKRRRAALILAFVLGGVLLWGACGGGSTPAPNHTSGTPAGTYTLTVTATSGSLTHNFTTTLTVK